MAACANIIHYFSYYSSLVLAFLWPQEVLNLKSYAVLV